MRASAAVFYAIALSTITGCIALAQEQSSADNLLTSLPDDMSVDTPRSKLFKDYVVKAALQDDAGNGAQPVVDLALPRDFVFPDDAVYDKIRKRPRDPAVFAIDVSHYTGRDIDFSSFRLQHIAAVYVKATQGTSYRDNLFAYYYSELSKLEGENKLIKGAYHFLSSSGDPKVQANRFVDFVNSHGGFKSEDLPPCMDFEWDRNATVRDQWAGQSPDLMIQKAKEFLETVRIRTGRVPIVYTAVSFLREHNLEQRFSALAEYPLWPADYSRSHKAIERPAVPLNRKQLLWQYASDTTLSSGYDGGLDASIYYGTEDQFRIDIAR